MALTFSFPPADPCTINSWADANNHQPYQKILYTALGDNTRTIATTLSTTEESWGISRRMPAFLLDPLLCIWLLWGGGGGVIHIYSTAKHKTLKAATTVSSGILNLFHVLWSADAPSSLTISCCSLVGRVLDCVRTS